MNRTIFVFGVLVAFAAGYSAGVIRANAKGLREDALRPAMLAVAVDRARLEGNARRAEQLSRQQLCSAIDGAAGLGRPGWTAMVFDSFRDAEAYESFAAVIAAHLGAHPDLPVNDSTRLYFSKFDRPSGGRETGRQ
jgi:hypothetical protein